MIYRLFGVLLINSIKLYKITITSNLSACYICILVMTFIFICNSHSGKQKSSETTQHSINPLRTRREGVPMDPADVFLKISFQTAFLSNSHTHVNSSF